MTNPTFIRLIFSCLLSPKIMSPDNMLIVKAEH